jgi:hypothetical protein
MEHDGGGACEGPSPANHNLELRIVGRAETVSLYRR